MAVGRAGNIAGSPHLVYLGKRDGAGMTHIGCEIGTLLKGIAHQALAHDSGAAFQVDVGLGSGTGILRVMHSGHMHAGVQAVVNLQLVTLTLEHVLSLVRRVAHHHGVIAPHAIVGGSVILHNLVNVAACLLGIHTGNTANTDAQPVFA